ncbi:Pumilio RNA-binding repeat [Macleaya cordata]|uniref:Pumilio RNA-binding repeat n=1 Tax=Macleaya cordata TaxID=56857 RepID=A0A200QCR2_MACCD|nr:Pumilio RNA-binding repeat [Macleaya cordata]
MAGEKKKKNLCTQQCGRQKGKNRRPGKEHYGFDGGCPPEFSSGTGRFPDKIVKAQNSSKHQNASVPQSSILRKQVDPETTQYFSEIANLFEGSGADLEERLVICGNALEETRGKELELATDYIISHTLQALLEGCDLDQLCGFLQSCAKVFPFIAMDRSGSHVAETALRSLAVHLQDEEAYAVIEETLNKICQVIVVKPVDVMCNRYGSHVLRSLLCLCKGMPLDSSQEFHVTKSSTILAERFNTRETRYGGNNTPHLQRGFPDLLKFLVTGMIECAREEIATLQVDQYSSLVLQTALKLLVGEDQELMNIIPILLGCHGENTEVGNLIQTVAVQETLDLLNDNAYSHLMEVILEVAPEALYNEILTKFFRNMLFEISSHHCGSFVIQALVSSARSQGQMDLIWKELGGKFKELLEIGRSGVVAAILAASQKLRTNEQKCSEALAAAVCSATESSSCIVPRILCLERYICCEDKSNWKWAKGDKMHVLGCLMLQTVFRYPSEFIQPYVTSITSMETTHVLEAAKDAGGGRVLECFLSSNASAKQKRKLIVKLRGHFGELSMRPSGSFTVEKCFMVSNLSLRETITSELLAVRAELSKTKQGPHLLRKLDVDGFAARPDQWRARQESKQTAYKDFYDAFGSSKTKTNESFLVEPSTRLSPPKSVKKMRKEIDRYLDPSSTQSMGSSNFPGLEASMAKLGFSGLKRHHARAEERGGKKFTKLSMDGNKRENKEWRNKKRKAGED